MFCKACYECLTKGKCVFDDDLNEIREKMTKANGLVIGDSKYDVNFLRSAGLGIAYKNDRDLINATDVIITDLEELLSFV